MSFVSFHLDRIRPDKFKMYEQDEGGRGFVAVDEIENGLIYVYIEASSKKGVMKGIKKAYRDILQSDWLEEYK